MTAALIAAWILFLTSSVVIAYESVEEDWLSGDPQVFLRDMTATKPSVDPSLAEPRSHVVGAGETLKSIAAKYGIDTTDLIGTNDLVNPDRLAIGQVLQIDSARFAGAARGGSREMVVVPTAMETRIRQTPLAVPFRSQLDGSPYQSGNCGPAALGMAMAYFGEVWSTLGIRRSVAAQMGDWSYGQGSTWESLQSAATERGFEVNGLYGGRRYRAWSLDDLARETESGRPVILLVRYWSLPGHQDKEWPGDHYIVFLGFDSDGDAVYHDPAFGGFDGARLYMSNDRLMRAWTRTWSGIQLSAMSLEWSGGQ
jgi:LysM repeat protein